MEKAFQAPAQRPAPLIGICAAPERARWSVWDQPALLVPASYVEAVQAAGGIALLLAPDVQLAERPRRLLELLDGLMLAGGADIDPAAYGAERHPLTVDISPERDHFEIAMARAAIDDDLPLLGICRGCQLINVALGGTLIQDLDEHLGGSEHRRAIGTFSGSEHDVEVGAGTVAASVCGEHVHVVRSHHHQAIDRLGAGLLASAHGSVDAIVEAIELPAASFLLGVQWHPEADPASPVVAALVEAARRRSAGDSAQAA